MGTRADFYVGKGEDSEWLGSIAWDGDLYGIPDEILDAFEETDYRREVVKFLKGRDDGTFPEQGWPWPWKDSHTTDCAYTFFKGNVWASSFGHGWGLVKKLKNIPDPDDREKFCTEPCIFPDMKDRQNVTLGKRSGVTLISGL